MTETATTLKPEQKNRNATIDILKGIGIILVVIGHSGCPQFLGDFISSFHMPLFLIASGVFFKEVYLDNKKDYALRKVKGIYLPFLKWSYIFLLLHNVFFALGIINASYGSSSGTCAKFFSLYDIAIRIPAIAFTMNGFDNYLLGPYWFLRSLFLGCLLLCFCSWLVNKVVKSKAASIAIVAVFFCLMGGGMTYFDVRVPYFPQGGYREVMAVFFIGCGYFAARVRNYLEKGWVALVSFILLLVCVWIHPTSMNYASTFKDWLVFPFSGICGFICVYYVSSKIATYSGTTCNSLKYIGTRTLYVLTFHFLMFKPASLLNAYIYHLDWKVIGCHPVVWPVRDNWFWIVYTVTALCLSLLLANGIERLPKFNMKRIFNIWGKKQNRS